MKRYIRAYKHFSNYGSYASAVATNNLERLYSNNILSYDDQLVYKNMFSKVFKVAPFYFDDVDLVDERTQKTIPGPKLDFNKYKEFTTCILDYFDIPISEDLQAKIDKISEISLMIVN